MISSSVQNTFFRFVKAGLIYNLLSLFLLEILLFNGVSAFISAFLSGFFGISISFFLNMRYTFKQKQVSLRSSLFFFLYNLSIIFIYSIIIGELEKFSDFSVMITAPLVVILFILINFIVYSRIFKR